MAAEVLIAITTLIGVVFSGIFTVLNTHISRKSHKLGEDINDSVNHRHRRGVDTPRLFDLVFETSRKVDELDAWKNGYNGTAFRDSQSIDKYIESVDGRISTVEECVLKSRCGYQPPNPKGDSETPAEN